MSREIGFREGEALALDNLGNICFEAGDAAAAQTWCLAALAVCEEIGDPVGVATAHLAQGAILLSTGDERRAREHLLKARDESAGASNVETLARCRLACLAGDLVRDAEAAFAANETCLSADERLAARWLLWKAGGDRAHLVAAKRLLDESVANAPEEVRASMLADRPVNREVAAAARAAGL